MGKLPINEAINRCKVSEITEATLYDMVTGCEKSEHETEVYQPRENACKELQYLHE